MVSEWTATHEGLTMGPGTDYVVRSVQGLGMPETRAERFERGDLEGEVGGNDVLQSRSLSLAVVVKGTSPSNTWANFQALMAAWKPAGTVDTSLTVGLPGIGTFGRKFYGRPGNARDDGLVNLGTKFVNVLLTYQALDPLGYGEPDSVNTQTGTFIVVNDGTAPTDRVTVTVDAAGTPFTLVNAADENKTIRAIGIPSGDHDISLRSRTVTKGVADAYSILSPTNQWFRLMPGSNSLTLSGATSVDVAWEPAYY